MTTLPLPPERAEPAERRPKAVSVTDIAARRAERDELLKTATALMAASVAHFGLNSEDGLTPDTAVDYAQMLIASVNGRFEDRE